MQGEHWTGQGGDQRRRKGHGNLIAGLIFSGTHKNGNIQRENSKLRLQVVGHTDSTGGDAHNKDLSSRRAASVMRALTQAGIAADRFTSRGAGASEPVAPNDNEAGRAKNRRVELVKM